MTTMNAFEFASARGYKFYPVQPHGTPLWAVRGPHEVPSCRTQREAVVAACEEEWRQAGAPWPPVLWFESQGVTDL